MMTPTCCRSEEKDAKDPAAVKGRRQSLPAPHQAKAAPGGLGGPGGPGWSKHYQQKKSVESLGMAEMLSRCFCC